MRCCAEGREAVRRRIDRRLRPGEAGAQACLFAVFSMIAVALDQADLASGVAVACSAFRRLMPVGGVFAQTQPRIDSDDLYSVSPRTDSSTCNRSTLDRFCSMLAQTLSAESSNRSCSSAMSIE